jgi:hypothetical protein
MENFRENKNFRENFLENEKFRKTFANNFSKAFLRKAKKPFRENTKTKIFVSTLGMGNMISEGTKKIYTKNS